MQAATRSNDEELLAGIKDSIEKLREKFFEKSQTSDLMLTMIVQIACVYDKADFESSQKQAELLSVYIISYLCTIAIDADFDDLRQQIIENIDLNAILEKIGITANFDIVNNAQQGIDNIKNLKPWQNFLLSIGLNISLFFVVGFVAKFIYQNYDNIAQILTSMQLFNQIKNEASKTVFELAENTETIENVIVECYEIEKIELETA